MLSTIRNRLKCIVWLLLQVQSCVTLVHTEHVSCRTATELFTDLDQYKLDTCAKCYDYIPEWAFRNKFIYLQKGLLLDPSTQSIVSSNATSVLSQSFLHKTMTAKWLQCCGEAEQCCRSQLSESKRRQSNDATNDDGSNMCPATWDGWACWPNPVSADTLAKLQCPTHIYWMSFQPPPCRGFVAKKCDRNGHWFALNGREWSNYAGCARDDIYIRRSWYQIITHLVSVAFIMPALFIFNYFRQLRNAGRIRVHKHLLSSLLVYSVLMALLTLQILMPSNDTTNFTGGGGGESESLKSQESGFSLWNHSSGATTTQETSMWNMLSKLATSSQSNHLINQPFAESGLWMTATSPLPSSDSNLTKNTSTHHSSAWVGPRWWTDWYRSNFFCVLLGLAVKYFRSTSYLWMFNEALYLHQLIKRAFTTPSLKPLLLIAYGIPLITTAVYVYFRASNRVSFIMITTSSATSTTTAMMDHESAASVSFNKLLNQLLISNQGDSSLKNINEQARLMSFIQVAPLVNDEAWANVTSAATSLKKSSDQSRHVSRFTFHNLSKRKSNNLKAMVNNNAMRKRSTTLSGEDSSDSQSLSNVITDDTNENVNDDVCWSLPSRVAWHEWIINAPNLLILLVNCIFLFSMVREIYMKAAHTARPARGSFQNTQRRSSSVRRTNKSNRSSDEQSTTLRHNVVFRTCVLLQRWKQKKRQKSGLTVPSSIAAASSSMDNYNVGATLNGSNKESHLQRPLLSSVQCNNCSIENAKLPIGRHSQEERGIENGQLGQQSNGHDQPDTNNNDNGDALARSDVGRIEKANLKDRTDRDSLANKSSNVVQDADQDGAKEEAKEAPGQSSSTAPIGPVTHMHSQCSSSATSRKSVLVSLRAASFLLPLYGLHYLVFAYRLDTTVCWLSELYHYCSITLDGLQGMLVSILFCFATNEVQQAIKRCVFGMHDVNLHMTEMVPAPN